MSDLLQAMDLIIKEEGMTALEAIKFLRTGRGRAWSYLLENGEFNSQQTRREVWFIEAETRTLNGSSVEAPIARTAFS